MAEDEDDKNKTRRKGKRGQYIWSEFDCPECEANNPYGDGFEVGDEVTCMFCGYSFAVKPHDDSFRLTER